MAVQEVSIFAGSRSFGGKKILSPEDAGLLSAFGVGLSRIERVIEKALPVGINNDRITKFEKELVEDGGRKFSVFKNDFILVRKLLLFE